MAYKRRGESYGTSLPDLAWNSSSDPLRRQTMQLSENNYDYCCMPADQYTECAPIMSPVSARHVQIPRKRLMLGGKAWGEYTKGRSALQQPFSGSDSDSPSHAILPSYSALSGRFARHQRETSPASSCYTLSGTTCPGCGSLQRLTTPSVSHSAASINPCPPRWLTSPALQP